MLSGASVARARKRVGHPAPFPVELPKRCTKLFSLLGDTVLDPFCGSGATLEACALTGRKGIRVEIAAAYCKLAMQRLLSDAKLNRYTLDTIQKLTPV
jgi:site-specific DNA-methyltransferase (adenine-specific)